MNGALATPLDAEDHVRGAAGADLELVMYGDFQCPYCLAAQGVISRVSDRLGDRLRFAFRHFPIRGRHPQAQVAAEASEAVVAAGGDFWVLHDALFAAQPRMTSDDAVLEIVAGAGFDAAAVAEALAAGRCAERVERDVRSGTASDVAGTPAFFVNGTLHGGSYDARSLVEALTS